MRPTFKCRQCPETFLTKRDLVAHNLRVKHTAVQLVCPWCLPPTKQRNFKWAQDLRRHVRQAHQQEHDNLIIRTLSTSNCYFFSREPHEYLQLFDAPAFNSPEAAEAQQLMVTWCLRHNLDADLWRKKWLPSTQPPSISPSVPSTPSPAIHVTRPSAPTPTALQTSTTTSTTTSGKRTLLDSTVSLVHIAFSSNEVKVFAQDDDTIYLGKLPVEILQDQRTTANLTRKMTSLQNHVFIPPSLNWKLLKDYNTKQIISSRLGIPVHKFISFLHQPARQFKLIRSTEPDSPQMTSTSSPAHHSVTEEADDLSSIRSPSPIFFEDEEPVSNVPNSPTTSLPESAQLLPTSPDYTATPLTQLDSTTPLEKALHLAENLKPIPSATSPTTSQLEPPPLPSQTPEYIPTPLVQLKTVTTQGQAAHILKHGNLPLLPAARREWSKVPDESISLTQTLVWPPKNWQHFTPDQRTLASEYAAMTLHHVHHQTLQIERTQLLNHYNFLVLPGCKPTSSSLLSRTQYYNYHLVKTIALGTSSLTQTEQQQVLLSFKKDVPSDQLIKKIDHVPLRLTK